MSEFGYNDWRKFLAHSWGTSPKQKAQEKEYNAEYYQTHKQQILARMNARYHKKNGGDSATDTEEQASSTSTEVSEKEIENTIKDLNVPDDAPEWLKNYVAEIKKVREATGDANWLPAHLSSFDAWSKELKKNFPDLNLSGSDAKEVFNEISKLKGNDSDTKSTKKSSSETTNEDDGEETDTSSSSKKSSSGKASSNKEESSDSGGSSTNASTNSSNTSNTISSSDTNKASTNSTASSQLSKSNKSAYDELVKNYRKGLSGESDAYTDRGEDSAYGDFGEFQAELAELGFAEKDLDSQNVKDLWEEFKKTNDISTPSSKLSKSNKSVYDELVNNYKKGAIGESDSYTDTGEDSAYGDYGEFQAELLELGFDEKIIDDPSIKKLWEEFKKTKPTSTKK